jgi:excinuclease UvrABC nuclease subunit
MEIKVRVPLKANIIYHGFTITVAPAGQAWSASQLGHYANKSGVYIHHSAGQILYIGKTTSGEWGNFGDRFRRQFQERASGNSPLYQILLAQSLPIQTVMYDLEDLDMMVDSGSITLTRERKALLMEQVLIGVFEPIGNRI